jgi:plastocyanin
VTSLRPGEYWLTVDDTSAFHNFHIFGPGLDQVVTTVPFKGTVTVKIHLSHGDYTFQCDPHANMGMRGSFSVGGVGQEG